jgi:hypothetical protein
MHSGIAVLQEILAASSTKHKGTPVPIYSLLSQLLSSLRDYIHADSQHPWIDFILARKKSGALSLFLGTQALT